VAATRASHSAPPVSVSVPTTPDTSGHTYQPELLQCDQVFVSLKTSKDISRWGCPTSSKTWQDWVTERRGAYSQRLKSAQSISVSVSSSWPTANARDWKDSAQIHAKIRKDGKSRMDTLARVVCELENNGQAAPSKTNTNGSRQESWPTPSGSVVNDGETLASWEARKQRNLAKHCNGNGMGTPLTIAVQQHWATPQTRDNRSGGAERWENPQERSRNLNDQIAAVTTQNAKLNPRWVETLMGLPVGWVMPSCASPVTIEPTNSDSSATELSPPPPNELFEFCLQS
jgi:hypothetical protein